MLNNTPNDVKKAMFLTGGIITAYALWAAFCKPPALKAAGTDPPKSIFLKHLPWLQSKGPIGSKAYTQLIEDYYQSQNQKSFCIQIPSRAPILRTVDPLVIKEVFSCPYKWRKPTDVIGRLWDYLGDGIFNANGTKWRVQRKQASYIFSETSLKQIMLPFMEKGAAKLVAKLSSLSPEEPFEMQKAFHDIFLDTFCQIAFGWNSNTFDTDSTFGYNYDQILQLLIKRSYNPLWRPMKWLGIGYEKELAERLNRHKKVIRDVVLTAREKKDMGCKNQAKNLMERLLDISIKGEPLEIKNIVDFVSNFIIAGRDTTATTLTWALYNLAHFPETIDKLVQDIDNARNAHPDDLWSQLNDMVYLEAWIWESMRFYAPVPIITKSSTVQTVLKDGSVVPKGSGIFIDIQATSWNPNIWENPRQFCPERHLKNGSLNIKSPEEMPTFNGGKRLCLGKKMAIMNAKLMFSELITRFEFALCGDKPAPEQTWVFTSKSSTGMWMRVKKAAI